MKCILTGIASFIACGLIVAIFLPSIRAGGAYYPKKLPIRVRVIDTDDHVPVSSAKVTFLGGRGSSLVDAEPRPENSAEDGSSSAMTDDDGYAEVMGTFRARDNRQGDFLHRNDRWYHLSGDWLKVIADGRPAAYVWLNGHSFGGERDYDNEQPLEVIVVMNKAPIP